MFTKLSAAAACAALAFLATSASAECSDEQQTQAATIAASITKTPVSKVVTITGKQMVNIEACETKDGNFVVQYKYNFLADGVLYWVDATAKFGPAGASPSIKFTSKSPSFAAAEAKAGVKLASS
jgi:hypothetical protein